MATIEKDIFGHNFTVGTVVAVRCIVQSITPAQPGNNLGGSGDTVNLLVETQGNAGEKTGVTLAVSPVQCRFDGSTYQL